MGRRLRLLTASVLLFGAVITAQASRAATFVGTYRGLSASFSLVGADRATYNVDLTATQAVASVPQLQMLYLDVQRCATTCVDVEHASGPLPGGAVEVNPDLTSASLATVLSGVPLRLAGSTQFATVQDGAVTVNHPGAWLWSLSGPSARTTAYMAASGTLQLGARLRCGTWVDIYSYQGVETAGDTSGDPYLDDAGPPYSPGPFLPAGLLHGRARPGCG